MPNLVEHRWKWPEALESKAVIPGERSLRGSAQPPFRRASEMRGTLRPTGSVFAANNVLEFDGEGCAAWLCTTVCRWRRSSLLRPLDEDLASSVSALRGGNRRKAVFAMRAHSVEAPGRPGEVRRSALPARMGGKRACWVLTARGVGVYRAGGRHVRQCKFRSNVPGIGRTVASANELAAQGSDRPRATRVGVFRRGAARRQAAALGEVAPRLLHQIAHAGGDAAGKTAEVMVFKNDNAACHRCATAA